jgi:hypothetical protein
MNLMAEWLKHMSLCYTMKAYMNGGILTQLYMEVTEKLQGPFTLTPKQCPGYPMNVRLDGN